MRKLFALILIASLAACGGGGGDGGTSLLPDTDTGECSTTGQKQFVLDNTSFWYLWNQNLPTNVDIDSYSSPQELLFYLTGFSPDDSSGQPVDRFSFITSAAADSAFFGEGRFEGFGFSYRFENNVPTLTRVFADSPAALGGLARGQQIVALDGRTVADIEAAEGLSAALGQPVVTFLMRETDGSEFETTIERDVVTIDPVPQYRIIPVDGTPGVGYLELATFISTAEPEFTTAFAEFAAAGVTDVIIDMRYNGGGLVSIAELLGDYLGGAVAQGDIYSETRFNEDRSSNNDFEFFELRSGSLNISRLVVIASQATASASELVINGLDPHVAGGVAIVGNNTFGKPVGQIGLDFCEQRLRLTAFQSFNSAGFGDYFDGLPVDCPAPDDLSVAVGADDDPNVTTALGYLAAGSCPSASIPGGVTKPGAERDIRLPDRRGPPWREFADAY